MKISLIAAVANDNAIGLDNKMPWHLSEDLRHFKATTLGKPVIMGRKTFASLKKPLPGRTNIIITRDKSWHHDGVKIAHSLKNALDIASTIAKQDQRDEIIVMGGAEIYRQALPLCQKIYLTRIYHSFTADTFFPSLNDKEWREVSREDHVSKSQAQLRYAFLVLEKHDPL